MENNRLLYFKSVIICCVLFSAVLFSSCENFMNGGDVKAAIDKAIYIANSDCPVATLEEPILQSNGVPKNSAIIITFSKPMNPETFDNNFYIEDSKGNSLKEYFIKAEWSNDNKYVKIAANEQKLIDLGKQDTMDVIVRLTKACTTPDELPIQNAINHKYKINTEIDNKAPEISSIIAKVPGTYIPRKAEEGPLILKEGLLPVVEASATATEEQIKAENELLSVNHIKTKFDIYIEGNDYGGGKVRGHVKYHQLYDSMGEKVSADVEEFYVNLTKKEDSDNYFGTYTIDLSDKKYTDGLYEIKVTVQDSYNLDSKEVKTYNVIRDTIFAYSAKTKIGLSSPAFRNDLSPDVSEETRQRGLKEGWIDQNYKAPTAEKIEECLKNVFFWSLPKDAYYRSKLTGQTYSDNNEKYTYYLSWGLDVNNLSDSSELTNPEEENEWFKYNENEYWGPLQQEFKDFAANNKTKNIIIQAKILDAAGNDNYITILYPKAIDFLDYNVSDELDDNGNPTKQVLLSYEDMTNSDYTKIANLPDRKVKPIYRVFYGKLTDGSKDNDGLTELVRNTSKYLDEDNWSDISDSHIIKNLDPASEYVVYVQVEYKTFSTLNSEWVGETFGPLKKEYINTNKQTSTSITTPEFSVEKKSSGINTGLFDVTVTISNYEQNSGKNVKYVPCYSTDGSNWVYYEAHEQKVFTIKVTNPLHAPFKPLWGTEEWDKKFNNAGEEIGDNSYFDGVAACKDKYGYPSVDAKMKIIALNEYQNVESAEQNISFSEDDDNIPPFITSNVTQHDSRLSYDGHFYQFENIVREDEGHLSEYYEYYYAPYQESWGDNLTVMDPEEIERLPGGIGSYTSSCYLEDNETRADYTIDVAIPVNGLADGKYMFFAKVTDTYGNYTYITLGKADIGTFKNKMSVEYDHSKRTFISTLPIEGNEHFDRNMIHVEDCWNDDNSQTTQWASPNGYFQYLNELQNCEVTTVNGKTVLLNDNSKAAAGEFIFVNWENNTISTIAPRELRGGNFYKITMQGFNENYYDSTTGIGVNRKYGRPYSKFDPAYTSTNNNPYLWVSNIANYVEGGETAYDVFTDETVSNTVYYFIPPINETTGELDKDYLKDIKSSFFADTATPRSNKTYLVNVIASARDLGNDADEWERRGKLIKSHLYDDWRTGTDIQYNKFGTFNSSVAAEDMYNSHEKGLVYYVAVVHFADGKTAMSNVYTMQGF